MHETGPAGDRRLVSMAPSPCPHVQHGPRRGQQTDRSDDLTMRSENLPMAPPFQQLLQAAAWAGASARLSSGREGQPGSGGAPLCDPCDLDRVANPSPVSTAQAHLHSPAPCRRHASNARARRCLVCAGRALAPACVAVLPSTLCLPDSESTHMCACTHLHARNSSGARAGRPGADPVLLMTSLRAHPASCPPHMPQSPLAAHRPSTSTTCAPAAHGVLRAACTPWMIMLIESCCFASLSASWV